MRRSASWALLLGILLIFQLISSPSDPAAPQTGLVQMGRVFNQRPNDQIKILKLGPEQQILNGGIGDGLSGSYFCSGRDEANNYRFLNDLETLYDPNYGDSGNNLGTYQAVGFWDECQAGNECHGITPDGNQLAVALPKYATNCVSGGKRAFFDAEIYESNPPAESSGIIAPRFESHPDWENRNYIDGLLYGRYLFGELNNPDWSSPETVDVTLAMGVVFTEGAGDVYSLGGNDQPYLDIPYSCEQLKWTACPQIARLGGYKVNPCFQETSGGSILSSTETSESLHVENERSYYYKASLQESIDRLAHWIVAGYYGPLNEPPLTPKNQAMRDIVVTVYNILSQMVLQVDSTVYLDEFPTQMPFQNEKEDTDILPGLDALYVGAVELHCCDTAHDTIAEYQHENSRICIRPDVCRSCLTKRDSNDNPEYNVGPSDDGSACQVPPDVERLEDGLYEQSYGTRRGYELYDNDGSSVGGRIGFAGLNSAEGPGPIVIAKIAHELVHAYFRLDLNQNQMKSWPHTSEADWEERLAVIAEVSVYSNQCRMGNCPVNYGMVETPFVCNYETSGGYLGTGPVTSATTCKRYGYPHACRDHNGNILPYCSNMLTVAHFLDWRKPNLTKLLAHFISNAPLLDPPELMTVNGTAMDFELSETE